MNAPSPGIQAGGSVLLLMTLLVKGSLPLIVFRSLAERGFDVHVSYYVDAAGVYTPDPALDLRASDRLIDLTGISPLGYADILIEVIRRHDIRVIVQNGCEPLYQFLPLIKAKFPYIKIVDILYNEVGHVVSHFLFENAIDAALVESKAMDTFVRNGSEKNDPVVHIVESGINLEKFIPSRTEALNSSSLVIGYVGRMSPEKNPLGFVDLAERLIDTIPSLRFRIFGEGTQGEEVARRVAHRQTHGRIEYIGYVDEVLTAFQQVDVLVVPSHFDGRPNIIMEANACGLPVIAAPVGGIPELIDDGENGFLCAPTDVSRITLILDRWLRDPESYRDARRKARHAAEQRFSRDAMIDRYSSTIAHYVSLSKHEDREA
jgi:glycosyltransferase involved in cell wall biosynthesis